MCTVHRFIDALEFYEINNKIYLKLNKNTRRANKITSNLLLLEDKLGVCFFLLAIRVLCNKSTCFSSITVITSIIWSAGRHGSHKIFLATLLKMP
jgi:hypothetical protein